MPESKSIDHADISGSPASGEPVLYLSVGVLRRAHGVKGEMLVEVTSGFPERIKPGSHLFVGDKKKRIKITSRRFHNDGLLLGLEGIRSPEQTAQLRGQTIYVPANDRPPLPEGEYYHHQIIGMTVLDEAGKTLGQISEIIETGANDVYVVEPAEGKEILVPALKQVLLEVNPEGKFMRVHLLPGLLDEAEKDE